MKILITGGAGFVGSNLAYRFKAQNPDCEIVVLDNLRRRGSELNLAKLKVRNIQFVHGDIRQISDLDDLNQNFDLLIEASAEPSVQAGLNGSPQYVLQTNLSGTLNCLDFARRRVGTTVFLSTSRVYSIEPLRQIALTENETRFQIADAQTSVGIGAAGIAENFPTHLPRSFYGATKLASEMMVQEYVHSYGLRAVINRCGVLVGAGQFGKTDQGVFTLWVAAHLWGESLRYTGFGGTGKQVRDLLHPSDLFDLICLQLQDENALCGEVFNVGGGTANAISLCELTQLCREKTQRTIPIAQDATTSPVDIPLYISDNAKTQSRFGWSPRQNVATIVEEIVVWLKSNESELRPLFF